MRGLLLGKHHSLPLQRAWNKYGDQAFEFRIIADDVEAEHLIEYEQFWIDQLKPEYNVSPTAGSTLGRRLSEEAKKHLSDFNTKTHCKRGHEFVPKTTKLRIKEGKPYKSCRLCINLCRRQRRRISKQ
jgi:group I intron endonuclease